MSDTPLGAADVTSAPPASSACSVAPSAYAGLLVLERACGGIRSNCTRNQNESDEPGVRKHLYGLFVMLKCSCNANPTKDDQVGAEHPRQIVEAGATPDCKLQASIETSGPSTHGQPDPEEVPGAGGG